MKKQPSTRSEMEAAAGSWLRNVVDWKRRYVEGLKNEILDLRGKLSTAHRRIQELESQKRGGA